jgi:hypothetical protein
MAITLPKVGKDVFFKDLEEMVPINLNQMQHELGEHPKRFTKVARLHAETLAAYQTLSIEIDEKSASIYRAQRETVPKPTEKQIESVIDMDEDVLVLRYKQVALLEKKAFLDSMLRIFESRGTMLVNLAKRERTMEGE